MDGPRPISYSDLIWLKELIMQCESWVRVSERSDEGDSRPQGGRSERQGHEQSRGYKDGSNICVFLLPLICKIRVVPQKSKAG